MKLISVMIKNIHSMMNMTFYVPPSHDGIIEHVVIHILLVRDSTYYRLSRLHYRCCGRTCMHCLVSMVICLSVLHLMN